MRMMILVSKACNSSLVGPFWPLRTRRKIHSHPFNFEVTILMKIMSIHLPGFTRYATFVAAFTPQAASLAGAAGGASPRRLVTRLHRAGSQRDLRGNREVF
jgi:hypothetical protein